MAIEEIDWGEERHARSRQKKQTLGMKKTMEVRKTHSSAPPDARRGFKVFGSSHFSQTSHCFRVCWGFDDDFVAAHLESVLAEHQILLTRIALVKDVQSAWLLLFHCASARACFQIRQRNIVAMFVEHSADRSWGDESAKNRGSAKGRCCVGSCKACKIAALPWIGGETREGAVGCAGCGGGVTMVTRNTKVFVLL